MSWLLGGRKHVVPTGDFLLKHLLGPVPFGFERIEAMSEPIIKFGQRRYLVGWNRV